ncbi:MAG: hypothetical protein LBT59_03750 [Clostridiales bacterium]|jgi:hypothetical protein|nr:hypothetical protein [Clostridiales bacterium]
MAKLLMMLLLKLYSQIMTSKADPSKTVSAFLDFRRQDRTKAQDLLRHSIQRSYDILSKFLVKRDLAVLNTICQDTMDVLSSKSSYAADMDETSASISNLEAKLNALTRSSTNRADITNKADFEFISDREKFFRYTNVDLDVCVFCIIRKRFILGLANKTLTAKSSFQFSVSNNDQIDYSAIDELNYVLANFGRKLFDYWINRYFYFSEPINQKHEKKIAKLFLGKPPCDVARRVKLLTPRTTSEKDFIWWLNELPPYFLDDIGKIDFFIHGQSRVDDYYKMRKRLSATWYNIVLIVLLCLFMAFSFVYLFIQGLN